MTETAEPLSIGKTVVSAVVGVVTVLALGMAQLVWLDRTDRISHVLVTFSGPMLGVFLGSWLGTKRRQRKRPRRHGLAWYAGAGLALSCGWALTVTAFNGGVTADAVVPTLVLSVVGTVVLVGATKVITPELVL